MQLLNTLEVEASKSNLLRSRTEMELADASSRIITFIDLAGHRSVLGLNDRSQIFFQSTAPNLANI